MTEDLEKIIKSYKRTLAAFCVIILFMITLFGWIVLWEVPHILKVVVAEALSDRFDNVEITQ